MTNRIGDHARNVQQRGTYARHGHERALQGGSHGTRASKSQSQLHRQRNTKPKKISSNKKTAASKPKQKLLDDTQQQQQQRAEPDASVSTENQIATTSNMTIASTGPAGRSEGSSTQGGMMASGTIASPGPPEQIKENQVDTSNGSLSAVSPDRVDARSIAEDKHRQRQEALCKMPRPGMWERLQAAWEYTSALQALPPNFNMRDKYPYPDRIDPRVFSAAYDRLVAAEEKQREIAHRLNAHWEKDKKDKKKNSKKNGK